MSTTEAWSLSSSLCAVSDVSLRAGAFRAELEPQNLGGRQRQEAAGRWRRGSLSCRKVLRVREEIAVSVKSQRLLSYADEHACCRPSTHVAQESTSSPEKGCFYQHAGEKCRRDTSVYFVTRTCRDSSKAGRRALVQLGGGFQQQPTVGDLVPAGAAASSGHWCICIIVCCTCSGFICLWLLDSSWQPSRSPPQAGPHGFLLFSCQVELFFSV